MNVVILVAVGAVVLIALRTGDAVKSGVASVKGAAQSGIGQAAGGILTAALLAIARAAGETAPLLFTSLNNQYWSVRPDQPTASLTVQIFNYAVSPYEDWHQKAWSFSTRILAGALTSPLRRRCGAGRTWLPG